MYALLRFLPRNHLSFLIGVLSRVCFPRPVQQFLLRAFCRLYQIELGELDTDLQSFTSLASFFVRELKAECRPLGEGLLSPVDGVLSSFGPVIAGKLEQIKGKTYSLSSFLRDEEAARHFADAFSLTFYLSPRDCHHIFSPGDFQVKRLWHIPGTLWPVNSWALHHIPELFSVNERVVVELEDQGARVLLVAIGATGVGSIGLSFLPLRTNENPFVTGREIKVYQLNDAVRLKKGERLGTFYLGSTVVVLFEHDYFVPGARCQVGPIKYGTEVGSAVR